MKRTLYLHIGLPKTGSTSIQMFLHENSDLLEEQGVCFPDFNSKDGGGHMSLVAYASLMPSSKVSPFVRTRAKSVVGVDLDDPSYPARFQEVFETSLSKSEASKFIITSESLYTQIRNPKQILALKDYLSSYFDEIILIGYLRSQESWIASRLSQTAKLGGVHKVEKLIGARVNDYYATLKPWWDVFGKANMRFRILDRASLYKGDLFSDFMNVMDVEVTPAFKIPKRENESLSADMISFLQYFNHLVPLYLEGNIMNSKRDGLTQIIEAYSVDKERFVPDAETTRKIRQEYETSNKLLCEEFFPDRSTLFDLSALKTGHAVPLDLEGAIKIAAYLWEQQQLKIEALKKENMARAKAAKASG